jgi:hypothetical protein
MRVMNGSNDERMVDEGGGRGIIWGTMPEINWKDQKKKSWKTSDKTVGVPVQISTVNILQHKWEASFIAGVTKQKVSQMSPHALTTKLHFQLPNPTNETTGTESFLRRGWSISSTKNPGSEWNTNVHYVFTNISRWTSGNMG